MNVGIISKDHLFLNKVSEKIDVLLDKYGEHRVLDHITIV